MANFIQRNIQVVNEIEDNVREHIQWCVDHSDFYGFDLAYLMDRLNEPRIEQRLNMNIFYHNSLLSRLIGNCRYGDIFDLILAYILSWPIENPVWQYEQVAEEVRGVISSNEMLFCELDCECWDGDEWSSHTMLCQMRCDEISWYMLDIWLRSNGVLWPSGRQVVGSYFYHVRDPLNFERDDRQVFQQHLENLQPDEGYESSLESTGDIQQLIDELSQTSISRKQQKTIKRISKIDKAKAERKEIKYKMYNSKHKTLRKLRSIQRDTKLSSTSFIENLRKTVSISKGYMKALLNTYKVLSGQEDNEPTLDDHLHAVASQITISLASLAHDFSLFNIITNVCSIITMCGYPVTRLLKDLYTIVMPYLRKVKSSVVNKLRQVGRTLQGPSRQQREEEQLTEELHSTSETFQLGEILEKFADYDVITTVSAIMAGAAVLIASLILGKDAVSKMGDSATWVEKFSRAGKAISHGKSGIYAVIAMVKDFSTWIKQIVESYMLREGKTALAYALTHSEVQDTEKYQKANILDYIVELTDPANRDRVLTNDEFRAKLDFCLVVCQEVQIKLMEGKLKLDKLAIDKHAQLISELKKLKQFACKRAPDGFFRITPFWLYLYGVSRTGKSALMSKLADVMLASLYPQAAKYGIPSPDHWKYAMNFSDKYMTNYAQEYCVMIDDIFQDAPNTMETPSSLTMINWVSCIPHSTVQASLEDKGMYFTSKLVVSSSNVTPNVERTTEICDSNALRQRIAMSAEVRFLRDGEEWIDPDMKPGSCIEWNGQKILFKDFAARATLAFVKHYEAQEQLMQTRQATDDQISYVQEYLREQLTPTSDPYELGTPRPDLHDATITHEPESWSTWITSKLHYPVKAIWNDLPCWIAKKLAGKIDWDPIRASLGTMDSHFYVIKYALDHGYYRIENKYVVFEHEKLAQPVRQVIPILGRTSQKIREEMLSGIRAPYSGLNLRNSQAMDTEAEIEQLFEEQLKIFNEHQYEFALNLILGHGETPQDAYPNDFYYWLRPDVFTARWGVGSPWQQFADVYKAEAEAAWVKLYNNWIFKVFVIVCTAKNMYDIYKYFGKKNEQPQQQFPSEIPIYPSTAMKYEFSKPARARVPKVIRLQQTAGTDLGVDMEGFYDDSPDNAAFALANSMVNHGQICVMKTYHVKENGKTQVQKATCLRIGGTAILANNHAFYMLEDGDKIEIEIPHYKTGSRIITIFYQSKSKRQIGKKDLAVYKCDGTMPPAKNIINHFPDYSIVNSITNAVVLHSVPAMMQVTNLRAEPISPAEIYEGLDGEKYDLSCVFRCKYETQAGQSGSPLIAANNRIAKKILGIATCKGSLGNSYYTVVSQFELQQAMDSLNVDLNLYQDRDLIQTNLMVQDVRPVPSNLSKNSLEFIGDLPSSCAVKPPAKTKLEPSLIYDASKSTMGPSVLTPHDPRLKPEVRGQSILLRNVAGYDRQYGAMSQELLDIVVEEMGNEYKYAITKPNIPRVELNHHQMINGIPGVLKRIEMDSSPGFPFIKERKNTQTAGKYEWFDEITNDVDGSKEYVMHRELQDGFEQLDAQIRNGNIPPEWVGYVCLKDEKRSMAKIRDGVTRTFICLPMTYNFAIRKYFGAFIATQHQLAGRIASSVGIDPARGWTDLYYRLLEKSDKWEDFDYKQWDQSLHPAFFEAYAEIISKWYGDEPGSPGYNARKALMYFLCHTPLIIGDRLFIKGGGQCSGCAITAEINCVIHDMLMYYVWLKLHKDAQRKDMMNLDIYRSNVALAVYGDDIVISIKDECRDIFRGDTIRTVTDELGMQITAADKTMNFRVKKPYEVTFLKRSFIADDEVAGRILCPIDKKVIQEIPLWIHKSDDPRFATITNCEAALREAYWHGKTYFNQLRDELNRELARAQYGEASVMTVNISYDYLRTLHNEDKLDVIAVCQIAE